MIAANRRIRVCSLVDFLGAEDYSIFLNESLLEIVLAKRIRLLPRWTTERYRGAMADGSIYVRGMGIAQVRRVVDNWQETHKEIDVDVGESFSDQIAIAIFSATSDDVREIVTSMITLFDGAETDILI